MAKLSAQAERGASIPGDGSATPLTDVKEGDMQDKFDGKASAVQGSSSIVKQQSMQPMQVYQALPTFREAEEDLVINEERHKKLLEDIDAQPFQEPWYLRDPNDLKSMEWLGK